MNTIPKIILQNPYRVLGVYANAPQRDIVSNISKAKAFLKVGKPVEFPLDLKGILPSLSRSVEMLDEAEAHLAIATERLLYTQFWFLKKTPLDEVAFNHFVAGNIEEAISIWGKQDNPSSIQNRVVCNFILGDMTHALSLAKQLYAICGATYINDVDASSTLRLSSVELEHQFLDALGDDVGMMQLRNIVVDSEWKSYIGEKLVSPLIDKISAEVEKTKKIDHKDADARKKAGQKLIESTKEPLQQLQSVLSRTDPQYQMIADKLGEEILQCGIDYYNNSDDDDAAITAMSLQKYAQSIVVGALKKQRCDENVKILQKIINNLPPKDVRTEDKAIKDALSRFVKLPDKITYAVTLLNETKPHLQSIKQKLGPSNAYYLKLSTQVVGNALHNVIEEVNATQKYDDFLYNISGRYMSSTQERFANIKKVLREAWLATKLMDEFELESDFKTRYNQNRNTLKSMCNQLEIPIDENNTGCLIGSVIIIAVFIIFCIANCH